MHQICCEPVKITAKFQWFWPEGTGKSLESVGEMKDGTMNLSRRKQIN